jgi:hypothetical protein
VKEFMDTDGRDMDELCCIHLSEESVKCIKSTEAELKEVSSAKSRVREINFSAISLIYIINNRGPSTDPWGTRPHLRSLPR